MQSKSEIIEKNLNLVKGKGVRNIAMASQVNCLNGFLFPYHQKKSLAPRVNRILKGINLAKSMPILLIPE